MDFSIYFRIFFLSKVLIVAIIASLTSLDVNVNINSTIDFY